MSFGETLKKIRTEHGDSLRQLGDRTQIHFTKISKVELGERAITEDFLNKFIEEYPLQREELIEAYMKDHLPEMIFNEVKGKTGDKTSKSQQLYNLFFKNLTAEEQKEIFKMIFEKLEVFSVKKGNYEKDKKKLEDIKKAIEEL